MNEPIRPNSPDDPRLAPYMNLRERTLRGQSLFIAEGSLVVERLLRSPWSVESVCMTNAAWQRCTFRDLLCDLPVYIIDDKVAMDTIVGFEFHQGILALGKCQQLPNCVEGVLASDPTARGAWVVLPRATKPDNLGLAFRSAAALHAKGVLLGQQCCDPFSRRALRVSMGGVLQVPVFKAVDLGNELATLRKTLNMTVYATILDDTARSLYTKTQWSEQTFFL
ncbi:MAG: TrmH family RNA methyltransferase, partial [Planctomycetia bacterium]|nr:TrmH family RNA methyltransferase [Planctomycetia bacterium]